MNDRRSAFLDGERPEDVAIYLSNDAVDDPAALAGYGESVEGGLVLVLDGEQGRSVFETATGTGAMAFAGRARGREGRVRRDLTGGECPDAGDGEDDADEDHRARFLLAFAEEQKEDMDGPYGEGDVVHAYVACTCGTSYSDRWIAGDRAGEDGGADD